MIPKDLSDVQEGDVLAQNVMDFTGNLLVNKGAKLTQQLILQLQSRGIRKVIIESNDPEALKLFEDQKAQSISKIEKIFTDFEGNNSLMELKKAVISYYKNNYVDF
ncbi:MAG: hypothetical protein HY606_09775 [Planctomycetes bacterium]|nr:hypothetical protein [Planctomycetota bacterium]